jgi:hypothetical protein
VQIGYRLSPHEVRPERPGSLCRLGGPATEHSHRPGTIENDLASSAPIKI